MKRASFESGQALILIVFAIVGLVGITGLAVDGGMAYGDRRQAQNAADGAAWAAALAYIRDQDMTAVAKGSAAGNGYDDNQTTNTVEVSIVDTPKGACGWKDALGKDINVKITSHIHTYFAPVVGIPQLTNVVQAITRSCESYVAPLFDGNAIVSLAPSGIGFGGHGSGTSDWLIQGGGIFANSSDPDAAMCGGAAGVSSPSATVVGGTNFACHHVTIGTTTTGASQYTIASYQDLLPPVPKCDGSAIHSGSFYFPQPGADGSKVAFSGDMQFVGPGLFCVTNSPGPYHGQITGTGVTFYLMSPNFSMKFNGGGNLTASAPAGTGTPYDGVLMFAAPQVSGSTLLNTQSIDLRGNGNASVIGSIIVPSASVTMYGNSGSAGFQTQVVGYNVKSEGNANINVTYNAGENYEATHAAMLRLIK